MDARHIAHSVSKYYKKKLWFTQQEVGLCKGGRLRADVVASNMGAYVVIVEVKSSVADFRSDKKWTNYQEFSNKLYFALSPEVYEKVRDKIPKGVGIFLVYESGHAKIKQRAKHREIDPAIRLNLMTRLAYRSSDTLYERKATTAGAQLVAETAVQAIKAIPLPKRKNNTKLVIAEVKRAIQKYVS